MSARTRTHPNLPCGHPESFWRPRDGHECHTYSMDQETVQEGWCVACGAYVDRLYGPGGESYYDRVEGVFKKWRLMD